MHWYRTVDFGSAQWPSWFACLRTPLLLAQPLPLQRSGCWPCSRASMTPGPSWASPRWATFIGVHKSTASRLAAALERAGLLARYGRRYRLGLEVIRLGTLARRSFDLVASMQPAMDKLSPPDGRDHQPRRSWWRGHTERGRGGQHVHPELLGRLDRPPDQAARGRQRQGAAGLRRSGPSRVSSSGTPIRRSPPTSALEAELAAVRRNGYATAAAEFEDGLMAVAAPVFDTRGDLRGGAVDLGPGLPDAARWHSMTSAGSARAIKR